jgi:predicted nucleotide-binding protein
MHNALASIHIQSPNSAASPTYSRATIIAAPHMLKALGHTGINEFLLEAGLLDGAAAGSGLQGRATSLAKYAIENPTELSPARRTIPAEIVRRATALWQQGTIANLRPDDRGKFESAIKGDGHALAPLQEDDDVSHPAKIIGGPKAAYMQQLEDGRRRSNSSAPAGSREWSRKVFIVHGHDNEAKAEVARFLERIDFEAIILHEQANRGRTIIEKVESNGDVGFAVVLLTPDDEGNKRGHSSRPRARQNVVLELGYFIGRLGRDRVWALKRGDVEIPSDFDGVVYETYDDHGGWKSKLARN